MTHLKLNNETFLVDVKKVENDYFHYTAWKLDADGQPEANPARECLHKDVFRRLQRAYRVHTAQTFLTTNGNLIVSPEWERSWFAAPTGEFLRLLSYEEQLTLPDECPQVVHKTNRPEFELPVMWEFVHETDVAMYFVRPRKRGNPTFLKLPKLLPDVDDTLYNVIGTNVNLLHPAPTDDATFDLLIDKIGEVMTYESTMMEIPIEILTAHTVNRRQAGKTAK